MNKIELLKAEIEQLKEELDLSRRRIIRLEAKEQAYEECLGKLTDSQLSVATEKLRARRNRIQSK